MSADAHGLADAIRGIASETELSGVVRVDRDGETVCAEAFGLAWRAAERANTVDTRFGIASGTKVLTALTIMRLVDDGRLTLDTTARSVLGTDLPLIDAGVTIEHLLGHRSGIGDYCDEDAWGSVDDYMLTVSPRELAETEDYLRVLDGFPTKFEPGAAFSYCNGGYVVLALIAERVGGGAFRDLVASFVCTPAGMTGTAFLRSDELPPGTAAGYLSPDGLRTNVFHLAVRGSGDGGVYSTAADILALWRALFAGRIVPLERVAEMTQPRSALPDGSMRYGLGFWLDGVRDVVMLEGYDAGVSFRSAHEREGRFTYTVLSNTFEGAWPIARELNERSLTW